MAELGLDPQVISIVFIIIWIRAKLFDNGILASSAYTTFSYFVSPWEADYFGPFIPISLNFRSACSASPSCSACATKSLSPSGRAVTVCTNTFPTGQSTKSSRICLEGGIAVILCH